jgi:hypothetical protein
LHSNWQLRTRRRIVIKLTIFAPVQVCRKNTRLGTVSRWNPSLSDFLILLGLVIFTGSEAQTYSPECRIEAIHKLFAVEQDTAVELELKRTNPVLKILTTQSGKVDSLLGGEPPPEWLVTLTQEFYGEDFSPLDVLWDDLTASEQVELMKYVSRDKNFWVNREFVGLKVRDTITFNFEKTTPLLGEIYAPGKHEVPIGKYFRKVEYKSHSGVQAVSGFELHFRGQRGAGELSNDAWEVLDLAKIERPSQHVHIVAPLSLEELKKNRVFLSAEVADYYRRLNLGLEMITVMNRNTGIAIRQSADGTATYFGPISGNNIKTVFDAFNETNPKTAIVHTGWAGFRGQGYYDNPNLWGIEVRAVSKTLPPYLHREVLDSVQHAMISKDFGISQSELTNWISERTSLKDKILHRIRPAGRATSIREGLSSLWYTSDEALLSYHAAGFTDEEWKHLTENNIELKMLIHDWSKDTLLIQQPKLLSQIRESQKIALENLKSGTPANEVMRKFLKDSELYTATLNSIGLNLRTVTEK